MECGQILLCCWENAKLNMYSGSLTLTCQYGNIVFLAFLLVPSVDTKCNRFIFFCAFQKSSCHKAIDKSIHAPCSSSVYDWFPWWCYRFMYTSVLAPFSNCVWIKPCVDLDLHRSLTKTYYMKSYHHKNSSQQRKHGDLLQPKVTVSHDCFENI